MPSDILKAATIPTITTTTIPPAKRCGSRSCAARSALTSPPSSTAVDTSSVTKHELGGHTYRPASSKANRCTRSPIVSPASVRPSISVSFGKSQWLSRRHPATSLCVFTRPPVAPFSTTSISSNTSGSLPTQPASQPAKSTSASITKRSKIATREFRDVLRSIQDNGYALVVAGIHDEADLEPLMRDYSPTAIRLSEATFKSPLSKDRRHRIQHLVATAHERDVRVHRITRRQRSRTDARKEFRNRLRDRRRVRPKHADRRDRLSNSRTTPNRVASGPNESFDCSRGFLDHRVGLFGTLRCCISYAVTNMFVEQSDRDALQCFGHGADLVQHVDAVRVVVDQALQAADLSLNSDAAVSGSRPSSWRNRARNLLGIRRGRSDDCGDLRR